MIDEATIEWWIWTWSLQRSPGYAFRWEWDYVIYTGEDSGARLALG